MAFAFSLAVLLNLIVPPFQNPDEPQHFSIIMAYALGPGSEQVLIPDIIRIMDQNDWWRLVGMRKPPVLPARFSGPEYFSSLDVISQPRGPSLYHFALGRIMRGLGLKKTLTAYYVSRFASVLFFMLALGFIGLTFRDAAAPDKPFLAMAPFCAVFLPQFMLMAVSVNPDSLSILLGSAFFYAAFSILGGRAGFLQISGVIVTATAAFFVDKSVFFLIPLLGLLPFFAIRRKKALSSLAAAAFVVLVLVIVGSWIVWYFPGPAQKNIEDLARIMSSGFQKEIDVVSMNSFNQKFIQLLGDSFYLRFGWAAFPPGKVIRWAWRFLVLLSIFGIPVFFWANRAKNRRLEKPGLSSPGLIKPVAFSLVAIVIQFTGVWLLYGTQNILVQGRYFFPMMTALALVLTTGVHHAFAAIDRKKSSPALKAAVLCAFFLLIYIVWSDILPVFRLTIRSPHPGM